MNMNEAVFCINKRETGLKEVSNKNEENRTSQSSGYFETDSMALLVLEIVNG